MSFKIQMSLPLDDIINNYCVRAELPGLTTSKIKINKYILKKGTNPKSLQLLLEKKKTFGHSYSFKYPYNRSNREEPEGLGSSSDLTGSPSVGPNLCQTTCVKWCKMISCGNSGKQTLNAKDKFTHDYETTIFFCTGQQAKLRCPDIPLPGRFLQILRKEVLSKILLRRRGCPIRSNPKEPRGIAL